MKKLKYTNDEFINLINSKRDDILILENYKGSNIKILVKCKTCGHEWLITPSHLLNDGRTCPNCTGTIKTNERFVKELQKVNPNIEPKETYKKNSEKILCKCKLCGHEWRVTPNNLISKGCGCPLCATKKINKKNTLTSEDFFKKTEFKKNLNIKILDTEYKNAKTKMKVSCNICGYEWEMLPSNILSGYGCPKCHISKMENDIKKFFEDEKVKHLWQVRNDTFKWLEKQSLDFYLPEHDLIIECQGEQHFKPLKHFGGVNRFIDTIERDKRKKIASKKNNKKMLYVINKHFEKNITDNIILQEIYGDSNIIWVKTDRYGNLNDNAKKTFKEDFYNCLYCFWQ